MSSCYLFPVQIVSKRGHIARYAPLFTYNLPSKIDSQYNKANLSNPPKNNTAMKQILIAAASAVMLTSLGGCVEKKVEKAVVEADTTIVTIPDSAIYGVVGESTTMHTLTLLTEEGKTLTLPLGEEAHADEHGGLFAGDKVSVLTATNAEGETSVVKYVNITSLMGRWTSLDRNFELCEDGEVKSTVKTESHPYTFWSMANANIILNADTFDILLLGPDSLLLENKDGIYVYKRQR